jgi:NADPH:quinone reductase-like Zn-dependent oxidoreductase
MEIRAHAIREKGGALVPFSYQAEVGEDDVLVKLTHRSITRGDLQMIENDWGDTCFPMVPSHEMVGIVDRTGSRVTHLKPGDRVPVHRRLRRQRLPRGVHLSDPGRAHQRGRHGQAQRRRAGRTPRGVPPATQLGAALRALDG